MKIIVTGGAGFIGGILSIICWGITPHIRSSVLIL